MFEKKSNLIFLIFISIVVLIFGIFVVVKASNNDDDDKYSVDYNSTFLLGNHNIKLTNATYISDTKELYFYVSSMLDEQSFTGTTHSTEPEITTLNITYRDENGDERKEKMLEKYKSTKVNELTNKISFEDISDDYLYIYIEFESSIPEYKDEDTQDEFGNIQEGATHSEEKFLEYAAIDYHDIKVVTSEEDSKKVETSVSFEKPKENDEDDESEADSLSSEDNSDSNETKRTTETTSNTEETEDIETTESEYEYTEPEGNQDGGDHGDGETPTTTRKSNGGLNPHETTTKRTGTTTTTATVRSENRTTTSTKTSTSTTTKRATTTVKTTAQTTKATTRTTTKSTTKATTKATSRQPVTQEIKPYALSLKTGYNYNNVTLKVGQTVTVVPVFTPSNATDTAVYWNSSRTDVAIVDSNGNIKAVGKGVAIITVKTKNGGLSAACMVSVS